jgi:hypothetical protein
LSIGFASSRTFLDTRGRAIALAKNTAQLPTFFGFVHLIIAKRRLFELHAQGAS